MAEPETRRYLFSYVAATPFGPQFKATVFSVTNGELTVVDALIAAQKMAENAEVFLTPLSLVPMTERQSADYAEAMAKWASKPAPSGEKEKADG